MPVKKQRKYNLARWAVTGRDDLGINAACERIYRGIVAKGADHRGMERALLSVVERFSHSHHREALGRHSRDVCRRRKKRWLAPDASQPRCAARRRNVEARHIDIATPACHRASRPPPRPGARSDSLRQPCAAPSLGGLPHGHFDDIALQADWYTGDCVFEAPGEHKVTDLEWAETRKLDRCERRHRRPSAASRRRRGRSKRPCASRTTNRASISISSSTGRTGARAACASATSLCFRDAFDIDALSLDHAQWRPRRRRRFALAGQTVDHGAPVSFLVSSSHGLGMTEGWAEIGDDRTRVRVEVDRADGVACSAC